MANGRTPKRRARQSEAIRTWPPVGTRNGGRYDRAPKFCEPALLRQLTAQSHEDHCADASSREQISRTGAHIATK
jgi:hypothetical protein